MNGLRLSFTIVALAAAALAAAALLGSRPSAREVPGAPRADAGLPRLVELGSESCQACTAMQPVLAQLRDECAGRLDVDFIDIWEEPQRARPFAVRVIPVQVFLDPSGAELGRHEGFLSASDIVAKWRALGFEDLLLERRSFWFRE